MEKQGLELTGSFNNGSKAGSSLASSIPPQSCALVIFGASGDLTGRKLIPALYNLYASGGLPERFVILGAARTEMTDHSFREKMHRAVEKAGHGLECWDDFSRRLFYQPIVYDQPGSYDDLGQRLDRLCQDQGPIPNRIFNLAVPPALYPVVAAMLGQAGLAAQDRGWVRLVVEKPFGYDLLSARRLNDTISDSFDENQVFRIDHYMAKDTVQNILMFRFANSIFEPLWNRNYIDYVSIVSCETLGVEHRAGYYEKAGVLRDMFQNHMMQLLALVAAEPPSLFEANRMRDEKAKLFRSLRPMPLDDLYDHLVLGQYHQGVREGRVLPAYRDEPGVSDTSLTPTFCAMEVFVDNWRWQGVPFYLTSGKRLAKKATRIAIQFKEVPHSLFRRLLGEHINANRLILCIHPDEAIRLTFQAKLPGQRPALRPVTMNFDYNQGRGGPSLDAYEKCLADAMLGDHMLFWRQDSLETCWAFLDPVLQECETCRDRAGHLHGYPAGSWGPDAALKLLPPGLGVGLET